VSFSLKGKRKVQVRVAVIDDHPMFREGVAQTIKASEALELVGVGANFDDAVRLVSEARPDVILLDIEMPGGGLEATRTIAALGTGAKIVILTGSESEEHVSAALSAGASAYVLKGVSGSDLLRTILAVHKGDTYVTPDLAARMLRSFSQRTVEKKSEKDISTLTPREEDILDCLVTGQTNKEIAIRLKIGEKTVKHYMTNIMHKLQVRNRVEAALKARRRLPGLGSGRERHGG
jgi:two-component system, NarL family, nitrate/nitrite response regulator NarL